MTDLNRLIDRKVREKVSWKSKVGISCIPYGDIVVTLLPENKETGFPARYKATVPIIEDMKELTMNIFINA